MLEIFYKGSILQLQGFLTHSFLLPLLINDHLFDDSIASQTPNKQQTRRHLEWIDTVLLVLSQ